MQMIKCVLGMMAVFGFFLIFGGIGIVETSQDTMSLLIGLMICLIGLLSMGVFSIASWKLDSREGYTRHDEFLE